MLKRTLTTIVGISLLACACESKPAVDPNAPKTPEWEACIQKVESYAKCKIDEAGQIDEGIQRRVTKQMKVKQNQSVASEAICQKALTGLPGDDPCVPSTVRHQWSYGTTNK